MDDRGALPLDADPDQRPRQTGRRPADVADVERPRDAHDAARHALLLDAGQQLPERLGHRRAAERAPDADGERGREADHDLVGPHPAARRPDLAHVETAGGGDLVGDQTFARALLPDGADLGAALARHPVARAGPGVVVRIGQCGQDPHVGVEDRGGLQVVAVQAGAQHAEHALGLGVVAAPGQRRDDVDDRQPPRHDRVAGARGQLRVEQRDVEAAVGVHDGVHVGVGEGGEAELVVHRAAGLRRAPAQRQQLGVAARPEAALEAPVALHDEVVVEVLRVEVRRPERVVVGRDRAEAGEQEVGAGQQQRQRVRGPPDVGEAHQRVVAGAGLEVAQHHAQVLGDHLAHAVGTDAVTDTPSMPPFCTPCAPAARVSAMHRDSR